MSFHDLPLPDQVQVAQDGTAHFARCVYRIADADLGASSLLDGWTRRHLIAHVGYNAAALCRLLDWAETGVENPMYESVAQRAAEIDEGAQLAAPTLRALFTDTAARLAQKWQELPDSAWSARVRTMQGRSVPATETAWMRTREVWIHAVDLGNGAEFGDIPDVVLESLLTDIVDNWRRTDLGAGLTLIVEGHQPVAVQEGSQPTATVAGPLPAVVRWAAGRGAVGLSAGAEHRAPRWL